MNYVEGDDYINMDSEMLNGNNVDFVIYLNSIQCWNGDPRRPLTKDDKDRMIDGIKALLKSKGISIFWQ